MKKLNVLCGVLVIIFVSSVWSNEFSADETVQPTGTSTEGTYPKPLMRTDRHEARAHRRSQVRVECASTDPECLHSLKTGPGQDSYGATY